MESIRYKNYSQTILVLFFFISLSTFYFNTFLAWDASYHLFIILQNNSFMPIDNREIIYFFQAPVYYLYQLFNNLDVVYYTKAYGLLYSFYSFLIICIGYYFHKKNTQRFYFLSLSFALGFIVHHMIYLSEHLIACQLYLLILSITDYKNLRWITLILSALLIIIHPVAIYLFAFQIATIIFLHLKGSRKIHWSDFFYFLIFAIRLYQLVSTKSEVSHFMGTSIISSLGINIPGIRLYRDLVLLIFPIGILVNFSLFKEAKKLTFGLISLLGLVYFYWYLHSPRSIEYMLDSRFLIFLLITPFYIGMVYIFLYKNLNISFLKKVSIYSVLILLTSSIIQGRSYQSDVNYLIKKVDHSSCIDTYTLVRSYKPRKWSHWATNFEYMINKGEKVVNKFIPDRDGCKLKTFKKRVKAYPSWVDKKALKSNTFFKYNL